MVSLCLVDLAAIHGFNHAEHHLRLHLASIPLFPVPVELHDRVARVLDLLEAVEVVQRRLAPQVLHLCLFVLDSLLVYLVVDIAGAPLAAGLGAIVLGCENLFGLLVVFGIVARTTERIVTHFDLKILFIKI